MIDQIMNKMIDIDLNRLWPYMSIGERKYLLGNLVSKEMDQDIHTLYEMMSTEEQMMVNVDGQYIIRHQKKFKKGEKN